MARYRKKPVVIEAEQFWPDKRPWPNGVSRSHPEVSGKDVMHYQIGTLERCHAVTPGDWIITGVKGEKYPVCKPDIFEATYEKETSDVKATDEK